MARRGHSGTGPGAITPDGCAVELYARLPVGDEPDIIEGAVPAGAGILELGSGVGRMTHPLVRRGFPVTAVDESPQMLERVKGARTVCSPIESLKLGTGFDVVLLASFLVHVADPLRQGFLETCRLHVADGGCVLIQREARGRHENLPHERPIPGGLIRVVSSDPVRPGVRSVHVEYVFSDAHWTQTFVSCPLSEEEFESALARAGLVVDAYLDEDRTWVRALPVTA
jgi:SAM-dependent methyltransferase